MSQTSQPKDEALFTFLLSEANSPFSGWDFSHITHRMVEVPLTWSYTSKILMRVRTVESLLDMGTGGGEFLIFFACRQSLVYFCLNVN